MATAEQVKALVQSHAEGDDARFYAIAMQVAAQAALATNESATARFDPVFVPRGENLELTLPNVQMPTNPVVVSNYSGLTNQPL